MIKNYIKIAWRNAIRQKQFTILNILGLSIGIATCFIIGLYVHSEMTYDTFHEKADRIYRVNQPNIWGDWDEMVSSTGPNVATALRADAPEFEEVTRLLSTGRQTIRANHNNKVNFYNESRYFAAEENVFDVFSFQFLQGDPKTALSEPLTMVMTKETAERYFGDDDPMGKTLEVKDYDGSWKTYTVQGIIAEVPYKSHLQFDMIVSLKSYSEMMDANGWKWIWTAFATYGLVKEGTDMKAFTDKIQAIPPKWAPPTTERIFNQTFDEFTAGHAWTLDLQPLREIYLSESPNFNVFGPSGNPMFVNIFGAIGILVLILSSINFMNLSTARSSKRAKEIGVRKVLGSKRKALIKQFVLESTLFVLAGTIIALVLVQVSLHTFNDIAEVQLALIPYLINPIFLGIVVLFILGLGLISGSYPAFYLSMFEPVETLKGKISNKFRGKGIRNGLVVFQFTISIALVICTLFVQKQLSYTSTLDIGFEKDNILQIHNIEQMGFDTESLKAKFASNSAFSKVGKSFGIPPNIWSGDRYKALGPENDVVQLRNVRAEEDYLDVLGVEFVAGGNFDSSRPNDKYKVILNEKAVKTLGWGSKEMYASDSPIGKIVALASGSEDEFEVLGVVKDFNFNSVHQEIGPLVIIHHQNDKVWDYGGGLSFYSMKLNPELVKSATDLQALVENVKDEIAQMDPSVPFEYSFMDQEFENTFESEQRMGVVLNIFTLMALIIACLGLFGLAAFTAEQRVKELSIRKVLGAKVSELAVLFSSEFAKLIGVSILLASPLAYFLVDEWLKGFAYRTPIDIWVFILAALCAVIITLLTVGFQTVKAASSNPIHNLRTE
ncbi:ABC transporter permease [Aquimarina algiphila]|uniref:FtsX-like permease family protein n=1 Tax=Aquimarina algiphila TaxID=2047982 RepID=A0A554VKW2_9FLAO|nr:ABC transporter permease [Aquimarina algiphila]TSE08703.1 FtsX-like permease family protein [Aquimarina algiphila]